LGRTSRTRTSPPLKETVPRLLSKRRLEIDLSKMKIREDPDLSLEQYPISPEVGAELLFMAGFEHRDIIGRKVLDLGTGAGRLAIGAGLLGAEQIVGVDIDPISISLARSNATKFGVNVKWILGDVNSVRDTFDTVVMNPPYGTRKEHADIKFLEQSFRVAETIYSIHKSSTRSFLMEFIARHGRRVDAIRSVEMFLPHLFEFHHKKWKSIRVDLYRIIG
jgi:predicted RNA methylase